MVNDTVSIIIRYHSKGNIDFLKDALFSVAMQSHDQIEILLMLHNCNKHQVDEIKKFIQSLSFAPTIPQKAVLKNFNSKKDIRSKLLNEGVKASNGRYLCFLDYDDIIYSNAFEFHVANLRHTSTGVSLGKCRRADLDMSVNGYPFIMKKKNFFDRSFNIFDQIQDNFIPIHSLMIDLNTIPKSEITFDHQLTALEDYHLLLRLIAKYEFDFTKTNIPVCEYRIRNDQSHTTPFHDLESLGTLKSWKKGREAIAKLKQNLKFEHSLERIIQMSKSHD